MTIQSKDEEKIQSSIHSLISIGEPKQYYVIMHNDNKTPFDFVIDVLMDLFNHDKDTAADLAHKIHTDEKAIVGMYNLEIAEQKIEETVKASRASNYPLTASLEPTS
jgi:ATP-dependent Clp protease adaptor protein ClpS|tara:strand:- start:1826 stop:2146 length:321 start_codon:yes stop_codon:yes gene_type:complete